MNTMLSRSGRSNPDGKLVARLDIPVSEELNERVISRAAIQGVPKAEFVRNVLERALLDELKVAFPVSEELNESLIAMAAVMRIPKAEYVRMLIERTVFGELSMVRRMTRPLSMGPSDESRGNLG